MGTALATTSNGTNFDWPMVESASEELLDSRHTQLRIDPDGGDPNLDHASTEGQRRANRSDDPTRRRFQSLVASWKGQRQCSSSMSETAMLPAYQQIIGMGRAAVPLLLEELQREPDHWFWALKSITGEDPAAAEHRGQFDRMVEAWLGWGREHGFIQDAA